MRLLGIISGFFLQKDFTHKKGAKMQTSDFHLDILYVPKALKSNRQLSLMNNIKSKQASLHS